MFLIDLIKPQIAFGSGGGSSGGGGGGGGSSKSSSSQSRSKRTAPKPAKSSGGGKGSKSSSTPKSSGGGRNLDADMFAGSGYAPTKNAGTSKASQVTYTNDSYGPNRRAVPVTGSTTNFNSKTSVTAKDLADGNVTTFKAKNGTGSLTVARGTAFNDAPQVEVGGRTNSEIYDTKDVATPKTTAPVNTNTGSSSPVTAPEKIDPRDGVGGGRDGGKASRLKASKTQEDKIAIERKAAGTDRYKVRGKQAAAASIRGQRANPMSIRKNRNNRSA